MDLHVFPILVPPPTSLTTQILWVFPVHQACERGNAFIFEGMCLCRKPTPIGVTLTQVHSNEPERRHGLKGLSGLHRQEVKTSVLPFAQF